MIFHFFILSQFDELKVGIVITFLKFLSLTWSSFNPVCYIQFRFKCLLLNGLADTSPLHTENSWLKHKV